MEGVRCYKMYKYYPGDFSKTILVFFRRLLLGLMSQR